MVQGSAMDFAVACGNNRDDNPAKSSATLIGTNRGDVTNPLSRTVRVKGAVRGRFELNPCPTALTCPWLEAKMAPHKGVKSLSQAKS